MACSDTKAKKGPQTLVFSLLFFCCDSDNGQKCSFDFFWVELCLNQKGFSHKKKGRYDSWKSNFMLLLDRGLSKEEDFGLGGLNMDGPNTRVRDFKKRLARD